MQFGRDDYLVLAQRYKELSSPKDDPSTPEDSVPYDIEGYLTQLDTGMIDTNYMNSRFKKYIEELGRPGALEALNDLHQSFASLNQEEQKQANILLFDIQAGKFDYPEGMSFRDIITLYQTRAKDSQVKKIVDILGVDEKKLRQLLHAGVQEANLDEFGRFTRLRETVDKAKAKAYFEQQIGKSLSLFHLNIRIQSLLKEFVLNDGIDL